MRIPVSNKIIIPGVTQLYAVAGYFALLAAFLWKECINEKNKPQEVGAIFGLNIFCISAGLISIFALFALINALIYAHIKTRFDNLQDAALDRKRLLQKSSANKQYNGQGGDH